MYNPTFRQILAFEYLIKNKCSLAKALLAAGYSESVSRYPKSVTTRVGFQKLMKPHIQELKTERDRVLGEMKGRKLSKEEYRILVGSYDTLNKNLQLLEGKPTEITKSEFSGLSDEELRQISEEGEGDDGEKGAGEEESPSVHPA